MEVAFGEPLRLQAGCQGIHFEQRVGTCSPTSGGDRLEAESVTNGR